MTTLRLRSWTAKRSGARMTIVATLPDGREERLSVDAIEVSNGGTVAIDRKLGSTRRLELVEGQS
ncbi:MAG TPA: hypothetical protein VGN80_19215 [Devosiaceae bacterium]|nr:hypothetical protein [Devosiaceae bacterium]